MLGEILTCWTIALTTRASYHRKRYTLRRISSCDTEIGCRSLCKRHDGQKTAYVGSHRHMGTLSLVRSVDQLNLEWQQAWATDQTLWDRLMGKGLALTRSYSPFFLLMEKVFGPFVAGLKASQKIVANAVVCGGPSEVDGRFQQDRLSCMPDGMYHADGASFHLPVSHHMTSSKGGVSGIVRLQGKRRCKVTRMYWDDCIPTPTDSAELHRGVPM